MRDETRELVDQYWADLFGLSVDELRAPATKSVRHTGLGDYPGVYVLMLGRSVVISSPPVPAGPFTDVLGPSVHHYADESPAPVDGVGETAYGRLDGLRAAAGEEAWRESGFAEEPDVSFAVELDGQIVAAGNLTAWRDLPADLGVLVHPAYAGRGLGRLVAAHASRVAVDRAGVARYRALRTNTASLRIATRLGFTAYGMNLAIRPG